MPLWALRAVGNCAKNAFRAVAASTRKIEQTTMKYRKKLTTKIEMNGAKRRLSLSIYNVSSGRLVGAMEIHTSTIKYK